MGKKQAMTELAQELGLRFDEEAMLLHGNYHGYIMSLTLVESTYRMHITVSAAKDGSGVTEDAAKNLVKATKSLLGVETSGYRMVFESAGAPGINKCFEKVKDAVAEIAGYLTTNGYTNCCAKCGTGEDLAAYALNDASSTLCTGCFAGISQSLEENKSNLKKKKSSLVTGLVGALLGALLGVVAIVVIGQLGYVAAISGVVMGVCTLKGYELLGGKITTLGVILSSLLMLVMVYVGNNLDWALFVAAELEIGLGQAYQIIPALLADEMIDMGNYLSNLGMLYLFTVLGAFPTVRHALSTKDGSYVARRAA